MFSSYVVGVFRLDAAGSIFLPRPEGDLLRAAALPLPPIPLRGGGLLGPLLPRLVGLDLLLPAILAAERGVAPVHEDVLVPAKMPPAPEAGVEVVVSELAGVGVFAGRAAGPRRRRAWVARHGVALEARLDVAGVLPGVGEVVVVLHWFLGSSPRPVRCFSLAVYWPGPGQEIGRAHV